MPTAGASIGVGVVGTVNTISCHSMYNDGTRAWPRCTVYWRNTSAWRPRLALNGSPAMLLKS